MTKNEIIRILRELSPSCIKSLDIVYHKSTYDSSAYYRHHYSAKQYFTNTALCEVLLSLYKLRGCIRAISLVYFDYKQGREQQLDWIADDCVYCETLHDFIKTIKK